MDDLARLLEDAAASRRLPPALRERLEEIFLERAALIEEPLLTGIDAPRPLSSDLRNRLAGAITKASGRGRRFGLGPIPMTTFAGALAAVAVLVLGILALAAPRTAELKHPLALPSPSVLASPSSDAPVATEDEPTPSPTAKAEQKNENGTSSKSAASTGKKKIVYYTVRYQEICFPEESCPEYAYGEASSPENVEYRPIYPPRRPPSPPRNLAAQSGPGPGEITLHWDPPEDAGTAPVKRYGVFRRPENGEEKLIALLDASQLTYHDSNLPFGVYYYRVKARSYDGISDFSNEAMAFTVGSPP